jgi:hypothetical protein
MTVALPRMRPVRQNLPATTRLDVVATLEQQWRAKGIRANGRVAVAVGSRGIANLRVMVAAVIQLLKDGGARPFIVPAMGSHGGATAEGQRRVLADYGITEELAPISASVETRALGSTDDGVPVHFSAEALDADRIVILNRVKPHTDFSGVIGSGILKMIAVGLGKQRGAASCHRAGARLGMAQAIRSVARKCLQTAPILCAVAVVEDAHHQTAHMEVLQPEEIESAEERLQVVAKRLMPRLPFQEIDLLIVDKMGKDISGAGMDPNVIGRSVFGYSSSLVNPSASAGPIVVRRIFVRDLTSQSHGNAIGIGLADFTTARLVRAIDPTSTYANALTSLTVHSAKIPISFDSDREAIGKGLETLCIADVREARVVRIQDTLSLSEFEASEAYSEAIETREDLIALGPSQDMLFDTAGNLLPMG